MDKVTTALVGMLGLPLLILTDAFSLLNVGQFLIIVAAVAALILVRVSNRREGLAYSRPFSSWLWNVVIWQTFGLGGKVFGVLSTPSVAISSWGVFVILHGCFLIGAIAWSRIHENVEITETDDVFQDIKANGFNNLTD